MTTAGQVKQLVKPLLERHPDLVLVGRWIFVRPIRHFARGILVGRMLDPAKFRPQWAAIHLFQWRRTFSLDWGEWLYNKSSALPGSWDISEPKIATDLFREIEEEALPALRAMVTLDDYLSYVSQHYFRHKLYDWPQCRIIVETALGDLASARATGRANLALWSRTGPQFDEETLDQYQRLRELCALLETDDRPRLAQLLHGWEAATARNLKIERIWEATPFPLES